MRKLVIGVAIATLAGCTSNPGPALSSSPSTTVVGSFRPRPIRERVETEDGLPFSFRAPTHGWERFGSISLNKSETGPQGAEAIIYWSIFPDGSYADHYGHYAVPCTQVLSPPVGPSATDLAAAVSTAPGTGVVTGPSDVTVSGFPANHVVLTVRENVGCDPGFFYTWRDVYGGALWAWTDVGDTIRVWIVDVNGTRLFIGAATTPQASPDLEQEIQQIIGSIRFISPMRTSVR